MNKEDLERFIRDNLDYTFESANEEYPAEVSIDYSGLSEKLQKEFYTEEVREYSKTVAANAIKEFITYLKQYTRKSAFDQLMLDGRAEIEDLDNELDAAFEEYKEKQNDK